MFSVYFVYHGFYMVGADAVAQVKVRSQGDSQMVQFSAGFFHLGLIVVYIDLVFVDDSVGTQADDEAGSHTAAQDKGAPFGRSFLFDPVCMSQYDPYQVKDKNDKYNIQKCAQPVVEKTFQPAVPGIGRDQIGGQGRQAHENINAEKNHPEWPGLQMSVAGACPADDPADNIIIDQEIKWCEYDSQHSRLLLWVQFISSRIE